MALKDRIDLNRYMGKTDGICYRRVRISKLMETRKCKAFSALEYPLIPSKECYQL